MVRVASVRTSISVENIEIGPIWLIIRKFRHVDIGQLSVVVPGFQGIVRLIQVRRMVRCTVNPHNELHVTFKVE
jgi:hypothetical protein